MLFKTFPDWVYWQNRDYYSRFPSFFPNTVYSFSFLATATALHPNVEHAVEGGLLSKVLWAAELDLEGRVRRELLASWRFLDRWKDPKVTRQESTEHVDIQFSGTFLHQSRSVWASALSWCRTHPILNFPGRFIRRGWRTLLYYEEVTVMWRVAAWKQTIVSR